MRTLSAETGWTDKLKFGNLGNEHYHSEVGANTKSYIFSEVRYREF